MAILLIIMFSNGIFWFYKVPLDTFNTKKHPFFVVALSYSQVQEWYFLTFIMLAAAFHSPKSLIAVEKKDLKFMANLCARESTKYLYTFVCKPSQLESDSTTC